MIPIGAVFIVCSFDARHLMINRCAHDKYGAYGIRDRHTYETMNGYFFPSFASTAPLSRPISSTFSSSMQAK